MMKKASKFKIIYPRNSSLKISEKQKTLFLRKRCNLHLNSYLKSERF
jgi:hypothetical protein